MKGVILAAGRGSRLDEIGLVTSKPALPLLGKSLLTRVYESMIDHVESVVVVLNPADQQSIELLQEATWDPSRMEIVPQNEALGSADALLRAWPLIHGPCIVSACDNLVDTEIIANLSRELTLGGADVVVALERIDPGAGLPSSSVTKDRYGHITEIIEKPQPGEVLSEWMALPLYAFKQEFYEDLLAIELSERNELEIPAGIQNFIQRGGVVNSLAVSDRLTVNTDEEYLAAVQSMLADLQVDSINPGVIIPSTSEVRSPVYVEESTLIGSRAIIGPFTYLIAGSRVGQAAEVRESIVFRGAQVADGASISRCIVLPAAIIDLQKSRDNHDPIHRQ